MTLQQQRATVFIVAAFLAIATFVDLCIESFVYTWYNFLEVLILLPSITAAVLLVRVWIKQYKRQKRIAAERKRQLISGIL